MPIPAAPEALLVKESFKFDDWPGSEDIIGLCGTYLDELNAFVADGKTHGWLN
jgi:hypothetical protein